MSADQTRNAVMLSEDYFATAIGLEIGRAGGKISLSATGAAAIHALCMGASVRLDSASVPQSPTDHMSVHDPVTMASVNALRQWCAPHHPDL